MTETIPKPREGGAGADDASESDPLLLSRRCGSRPGPSAAACATFPTRRP